MVNASRYDAILALYPNAVIDEDFVLQNNSDGRPTFLAYWNEAKLGPEPTDEVILTKRKELRDDQAANPKADQTEAVDAVLNGTDKSPLAVAVRALIQVNGKTAQEVKTVTDAEIAATPVEIEIPADTGGVKGG